MLFIRKNMTSPHNTFDWKSYGHELHTHSTDIPLKALMILYYTTLIFLGQICLRGEGAMRLTLCEAPTCETRPDHYSGNSVPYSLQQVSGFFNVPCWLYNTEDAGDGAYDLSSLSEKTRTSNHLQMSLQRQHVLLSYFKTLSVGLVWGSNPRPPAQQFQFPWNMLNWEV